jgi:8-oxo-dGTP diphosphatase
VADDTHIPALLVRPDGHIAWAGDSQPGLRKQLSARELMEETGVPADRLHLEQLASYGAPQRDPRMRVVTVAYLGLAPDLPLPAAGGDAAGARWASVSELVTTRLAFDHRQILADGVERARAKLEYTPLATTFCAGEFTVAELRRVYEIVWGTELDSRNFHRKVTGTEGFLIPTGQTTTRDGGRPAQLYRPGELRFLHPPMTRATDIPNALRARDNSPGAARALLAGQPSTMSPGQ